MSEADGSYLISNTEESNAINLNQRTKKWVHYLSYITVEPTMFLYMFAFMITSVVEQGFFVYKACTINMGYNETICNNLTAFPEENKKVQVIVSDFHMYNDIASQAVPIVLSLFIGSWSDRRGRKILLLVGLLGKLWYSVWVVINSLFDWDLNVLLYTACAPAGITGADLAIFAASFSYIADITTEENRTLRVTILDITYLTSIPCGVALGSFLFYSVVNKSYTIMFAINASLLVASFLYSLFRLDWITTENQKMIPIPCTNHNEKNLLIDFFDKNHFIKSLKTITMKRPIHGLYIMWMLIIALCLYTFQRDERNMSYLYMNLKFHWDISKFSNFRTFQSSLYVAGTLLCLPLMSRFLRFSDTTIVMMGSIAHAAARVLYVFAEESWLFYLGAGISAIGPVSAPVIRSMASKIVPKSERGKLFAVISVGDSAVPLFSGIAYSTVYNNTINSYPSSIYWVTVATQMTVFALALIIKIITRKHALEECALNRTPPSEEAT